ncbi:hypothetical protein B296_00029204 [Ensete ventricosum]|uniref:Beta-glucosidase n=1 Tax=Ensete ventricosum TaxID=4639 RepID=A0A426Z4M6_ENSVE|nr:hypothetical protein B296_00029204 [Ensete ventricosum]
MMMIGMDQPGNVTLQGGLWDAERINYYKSYITELKRAIDDGVTVIGYFAWSLLDNFEWRLGYTSRQRSWVNHGTERPIAGRDKKANDDGETEYDGEKKEEEEEEKGDEGNEKGGRVMS